ncbi:hypothetical protein J1N35_015203 [Gossypium stocksii]|uniref:Uncharacterized protein n=1 Tax=Gossypium stocksii TaxID=47602 RepID=A0A9D3VVZ9_9ROSI|nr:hypothetical protein J1N35_015203 [Gossypium stocksii]
MTDCVGLLQYWALYMMLFLVTVRHQPYTWPLFLWMLNFVPNVATLILWWVHVEAHVWCINTPVLNFSTIECYSVEHQRYIALWNAQNDRQPEMISYIFDFSLIEYMQWYMAQ